MTGIKVKLPSKKLNIVKIINMVLWNKQTSYNYSLLKIQVIIV